MREAGRHAGARGAAPRGAGPGVDEAGVAGAGVAGVAGRLGGEVVLVQGFLAHGGLGVTAAPAAAHQGGERRGQNLLEKGDM